MKIKTCPKCNETKSLEDYGKSVYCKPCWAAYQKTMRERDIEKTRKYLREWNRTEHGQSVRKAWRQANRHKECEYQKRNIAKHPEKQKARMAVLNAMRRGEIAKPKICSLCGGKGKRIEAHHHKGYDEANWFNVQWLCSKCHGVEKLASSKGTERGVAC